MPNPNPTLEEDFRFVFAKMGKPKIQRSPATTRTARGNRYATGTAGMRNAVLSATKRKPQVMVKITSFGKAAQTVAAHLDYISREGKTEIFDSQGDRIDAVAQRAGLEPRQVLQEYAAEFAAHQVGQGASKQGRPRERVTANIMLSMPAGTETGAFELGVRDFLRDQFSNHDHVFTFHSDRAHYHSHVVVGLQGYDGHWLNPRKADIGEWRENFAAALERHGIPAEATPSYSRGKPKSGYRRDLKELATRGNRHKPETSPTYQPATEALAIQRRAEAWTRIAGHYRDSGDPGTAAAIRAYIADRYEHQVPPSPTNVPIQQPTTAESPSQDDQDRDR